MSVWTLDPSIVFLNHGSFGACPRVVLEEQARLRARMEAEPVRFLSRELPDLLQAARVELAGFLRADAEDLVFVPNATTGVNAVLRSLVFAPGDELLTTDHAYPACKNALAYVAERAGAKVVTATVPFPLRDPGEVTAAVLAAVTPRTRLALIDHVTSPTALIFPIEQICAELGRRGIDVLVDGAHAPGMLDLDVPRVGGAYYTGNCHKWMCAPKGAAFLWVRRDRQQALVPTSVSIGWSEPFPARTRFQSLFDWTGTADPTAMLSVPAAMAAMGGLLPGGWPELREKNRALARAGRELVCARLGVAPPCPEQMLGSMAALLVPGTAADIGDRLFARHHIEVPVKPAPTDGGDAMLRISAQLYNQLRDYEALATALELEIQAAR